MANYHAPSYGASAGFREHTRSPGNPQETKGNRRSVEAHPCRMAQNDAGTSGMVCRLTDTVARRLFSWRSVVRLIGGIYRLGRLHLMVHDDGAFIAWRQVIQWEWRRSLPRQSGRT